MPIYEYQCARCGQVIEAVQKMSDPPLTDCQCGARDSLSRLISRSSFQLKGAGWYTSDYKNSGSAKTEEKAAAEPNGKPPTASSGPGPCGTACGCTTPSN